MRPTALVLNIIVASFTMFRFWRVGLFRWRTLWPFLIGAIPLGFVGGAIVLPTQIYRPLVGLVLFVAAARFLRPQLFKKAPKVHDPPVLPAIVCGAFSYNASHRDVGELALLVRIEQINKDGVR